MVSLAYNSIHPSPPLYNTHNIVLIIINKHKVQIPSKNKDKLTSAPTPDSIRSLFQPRIFQRRDASANDLGLDIAELKERTTARLRKRPGKFYLY
jgi:hypothetical protein